MHFEIAYGKLSKLLWLLAMGPKQSGVDVTDDTIEIRMGWAFRASIPRSSVSNVELLDNKVVSIGVHGWAGRWLVNGAGNQLIRIDIEPQMKARTAFVPIKLRELTLSITKRDELHAMLTAT